MIRLREGWTTVFLLVALMSVAAWGIQVSGWTAAGLEAVMPTAVLGVLAGLVLAKSRFRGLTASIFALVYGLFAAGFFVGLYALVGTWHQRALVLVIRINNFLYYALHGGTSRDELPFPVSIALIFWIIGVYGAWHLFRHGQIWPAVIPAGVALLINVFYYLGPEPLDAYLGVYLVLALLLIARLSLLDREREWRRARVAYAPDVRGEFLRAGLVLALGGVMIAWAGPSMAASPQAAVAWNQASGWWAVVRENFERLYNAVRNPGLNVNDFYGDSLVLGGGPNLGNTPMMNVIVQPLEDPVPGAAVPEQAFIPRYYWRAASYQAYDQGRWQLGDDSEFKEVDPNAPGSVRLPSYRLRRDVAATFLLFAPATSRLYSLPQTRWIDRPATFELTTNPGGTMDIVSLRARGIVQQGESYQVVASMSAADVTSLRATGRAYPQWTRAYLELPPEITPRTRALAQQIVEEADAVSPYDQAQAITDWLRRNITYDLNLAPPPSNAEPLDWFLFENRRGYCNYYASAEVILLRSIGIPARMAVGFAQGEYRVETGAYHVLQENAHAWPEVYFTDHGWVEFEPTAGQPPLVRREGRPASEDFLEPLADPSGRDGGLLEDDGLLPEDRLAGQGDSGAPPTLSERIRAAVLWFAASAGTAAGLLLVSLIALMHFGLLGWESLGQTGARVLRWRGLPVPSLVQAAYLRLERAARWLGLDLPDHFTPYERAAHLSRSLPAEQPHIATITEQHVVEQYSPEPAEAGGASAQAAWRAMRLNVWRASLRRQWHAWLSSPWVRSLRRWLP